MNGTVEPITVHFDSFWQGKLKQSGESTLERGTIHAFLRGDDGHWTTNYNQIRLSRVELYEELFGLEDLKPVLDLCAKDWFLGFACKEDVDNLLSGHTPGRFAVSVNEYSNRFCLYSLRTPEIIDHNWIIPPERVEEKQYCIISNGEKILGSSVIDVVEKIILVEKLHPCDRLKSYKTRVEKKGNNHGRYLPFTARHMGDYEYRK